MFRSLILTSALFFSGSALACPMADAAAFAAAAEAVQKTDGAKASFVIDGMTCGSCSDKVVNVLAALEGVFLSAADYQTGRIEVAYDEKKTSIEKLEEAIASTGYKITDKPKG